MRLEAEYFQLIFPLFHSHIEQIIQKILHSDWSNRAGKDDVPSDTLELLCIEIEPPRSRSYFVIAWYRPPSYPVDSFDKQEKALAYLDRECKEMIFLGDTDCDFTNTPGDQLIDNNARHLARVYEVFDFVQLVGEPTRVTLETATIIDHVATTCARNITKTGVHEVSLSDHYMVYCIRKFSAAVKKIIKRLTLEV